jgi:hypothetical protein
MSHASGTAQTDAHISRRLDSSLLQIRLPCFSKWVKVSQRVPGRAEHWIPHPGRMAIDLLQVFSTCPPSVAAGRTAETEAGSAYRTRVTEVARWSEWWVARESSYTRTTA